MGTWDKILGRRVMAGNLDPVIIHRNRTTDYLDALLEERRISGSAMDFAPGAAMIVLTEILVPGISYNILEGQIAVITTVRYGLHTLNDDCHFEIGWTTAIDGGGVFTPLLHQLDFHSGNVQSGPVTEDERFAPPLGAWYRKGARSITFRVHANDAVAEISCGWNGMYVTE